MNREETKEIIRLLCDMYPKQYNDLDNQYKANRIIDLYSAYFQNMDFRNTKQGLYNYFESENGKYFPSIYTIKEFSRLAKKNIKSSQKGRRIVTAEEDCANEYIEITKKGIGKLSEKQYQYVIKLQPCYLLFHGDGWQERYKKHFNTTKSREEYEKMD